MKNVKLGLCILALSLASSLAQSAIAAESATSAEKAPIELQDMGSFMFGGSLKTAANGDTFHGDHGYAQYFIPSHSKNLPIIMWHGGGESGKSWETTSDGRDGFWQIFTRAQWPVVIIDQPRRGRAGRTDAQVKQSSVPTDNSESVAWNTFRLGTWVPPGKPTFFKNSQFPQGDKSVDQFMRWQTPNTGIEAFPDKATRDFMGNAGAALLKDTGPAILMTHSFSGQYGWATAIAAPDQVKGIIAFEPGEFAFPDNDVPADIPSKIKFLAEAGNAPQLVSEKEFQVLTRMPILIIMGDNISDKESNNFGVELWRVVKKRATQFVDTVNRHGGHAELVILPDVGIHGNTHFAFADKNNIQVANLVKNYLHQQGLDSATQGYHLNKLP